MAESHDAVALAGYLWRSPGAYRLHLRGLSLSRLEELSDRKGELADEHREVLAEERAYRTVRPWMQYGAVDP